MLFNTQRKTIRWKFIKSLEPPRVSHVRTAALLAKDNLFAQITVRLHTQQVSIISVKRCSFVEIDVQQVHVLFSYHLVADVGNL